MREENIHLRDLRIPDFILVSPVITNAFYGRNTWMIDKTKVVLLTVSFFNREASLLKKVTFS